MKLAALGMLCCLVSAAGSGQTLDTAPSCPEPTQELLSRPNPADGATKVAVGFYVLDLSKIDDVEQSFTIDLHLAVSWNDPRLRSQSDRDRPLCTFPLEDVWHPFVGFINQRQLERYFEDVVVVDKEGDVLYRQRVYGDFSSPLELSAFPFDTQVLPIAVASFRYDAGEVALRLDEDRSGRLGPFSIAGWSAELGGAELDTESQTGQGRKIARLTLTLLAERSSGFHIWKVFVPLSLIVAMAWAVFWIDPAQLAPQMGVSTASVLTLIAFQLSLGYLLPRVSYLTRADLFVLGSSVLVFLALGEAILSSRLAHSGRVELALTIDRQARWIYPTVFFVMSFAALRA